MIYVHTVNALLIFDVICVNVVDCQDFYSVNYFHTVNALMMFQNDFC